MLIAVDAGHGLFTSGKRCLKSLDPNETREWTLNSRVATKICKLFENMEYNTIRLDDVTGAKDVALKERTETANAANADYLISIHHNAGANGGSGGGLVVIRQQGLSESTEAAKLQKAVYTEMLAAGVSKGNRSNPTPTQNLHMTRESEMPAILIECGFMDSRVDVPVILTDAFAEKCATGIVNGFLTFSGKDKIKNDQTVEGEYSEVVEKTTLLLNGKEIKVNGILKDNTNYVNLREICKFLGAKVEYDDDKKMPVIEK